MKKSNRSEKLKEIIEKFSQAQNHNLTFSPIFVHANLDPVKILPEMLADLPNWCASDTFNYLVYVAKIFKGEKFTYYSKMWSGQSDECPINTVEEKGFEENQVKELISYVSTPSRIFDLQGKDRCILFFENKTSNQESFELLIETWRQTLQIQS